MDKRTYSLPDKESENIEFKFSFNLEAIETNPVREERWEYPPEALREIVMNMIVHRDYTHHGDSSIKIFPDRIEFFNPGGLPDGITIEDLMAAGAQNLTLPVSQGVMEQTGTYRAACDEPKFAVDVFSTGVLPS